MNKEHVEEYLGAIYRLRESPDAPLPLTRLQEYFKFSPISIHEMVQKLENQSLVNYIPYQGVTLTKAGEPVATALIRRHRIWERFLTDSLEVSWDTAHEVASQLEHAAPEMVTERLAVFLGDPQQCPHGCQIPAGANDTPAQINAESLKLSNTPSRRLDSVRTEEKYRVSHILPEFPEYLQKLRELGIQPGIVIELIEAKADALDIQVEGARVEISGGLAQTVWVDEAR